MWYYEARRSVVLSCLLFAVSVAAATTSLHDRRVAKCRYIVKTLYPHEGTADFLPYVDYFITRHEAAEGGCPGGAPGFGAMWYWSLVYGAANFELRCHATSEGSCAGPMDVKHHPVITDPKKNIDWHVNEMLGFYQVGVRDIDLCYHVFLPKHPRDWGGGRFKKTHRRFQECLRKGYLKGDLK